MESFKSYELLLSTIARRMLRERDEVEDIVQESYLRYATATPQEIHSLKAYLETIVTRLCLDLRKSARWQKEELLGLHISSSSSEELEVSAFKSLEQQEIVACALRYLLECLTPEERAAFLLHDIFAYAYEEIAQLLERRPDACRQLVHRAKARLVERRSRFPHASHVYQRFVDCFLMASQQGDLQALIAFLLEDLAAHSSSYTKRRHLLSSSQKRKEHAMFTGIVEEVGTILRCEPTGLVIQTPSGLAEVTDKDSIAVDGTCLTVIERGKQWVHVETVPETLRCTHLGDLTPGSPVNLERSVAINGRLGGHLVQGHIEATVAVQTVRQDGIALYCEVELPPHLRPFLLPKGFVALNGVSLTVIGCLEDRFSLTLIPYTRQHTNLGQIQRGTRLNLETDIVGRYIAHQLEHKNDAIPMPDSGINVANQAISAFLPSIQFARGSLFQRCFSPLASASL